MSESDICSKRLSYEERTKCKSLESVFWRAAKTRTLHAFEVSKSPGVVASSRTKMRISIHGSRARARAELEGTFSRANWTDFLTDTRSLFRNTKPETRSGIGNAGTGEARPFFGGENRCRSASSRKPRLFSAVSRASASAVSAACLARVARHSSAPRAARAAARLVTRVYPCAVRDLVTTVPFQAHPIKGIRSRLGTYEAKRSTAGFP